MQNRNGESGVGRNSELWDKNEWKLKKQQPDPNERQHRSQDGTVEWNGKKKKNITWAHYRNLSMENSNNFENNRNCYL